MPLRFNTGQLEDIKSAAPAGHGFARFTFLIALPGGGWFEIYAAEGAPTNRGNNKLAGFRHIALRVDSLDAAKVELVKRGVKFPEAERPAAGGGQVLFFEDCDGNLLHLVERQNNFPGDKS